MGSIALAFDRVSFTYVGQARPPGGALSGVMDISFAISPGEIVALVGPSGAGKSTLARLALGLERPATGEVWLGARRTREAPVSELARTAGLLLQNPLHQLLAGTVEAELHLGLRHLPDAEARERVEAALRTFDLAALRTRHPLALSEGQRRRVALASVLVRRPALLVLDEPALGQDEHGRAALVAVTRELAGQGVAVLAISHDPEFVNDACDRVLALDTGRLVADIPLGSGESCSDVLDRLVQARVPLADIPATVRLLAQRGFDVRARTVDEFVARVSSS